MAVSIRAQNGTPIRDLRDWEEHASTPGRFVDHYSAKELARLWLSGEAPQVYVDILGNALPGLTLTEAVAEAQVAFDGYPGGKRNHDVLAVGRAEIGEVVVGIEGKVNESLDDTLAGKLSAAEQLKRSGKNTNLDKRVRDVFQALAGRPFDPASADGQLRYQLFSAIAGTLAAATEKTQAAVMLVHLIETPQADPAKFEQTRAAISAFAETVFGTSGDGSLIGPVKARSGSNWISSTMPLWFGVVDTPPARAA